MGDFSYLGSAKTLHSNFNAEFKSADSILGFFVLSKITTYNLDFKKKALVIHSNDENIRK